VLHRNDFATLMIDGRTVGELDPASRSAIEVRDLWRYITKRLTMEARHVAAA
jgi:chromosome partitioning protein